MRHGLRSAGTRATEPNVGRQRQGQMKGKAGGNRCRMGPGGGRGGRDSGENETGLKEGREKMRKRGTDEVDSREI